MELVLSEVAETEILDAYDWYEQQQSGLGKRFLNRLREVLTLVKGNPYAFPKDYRSLRKKHLGRFPYSIYYRIESKMIIVHSCFHQSRDPGALTPPPETL